MIAPIQLSLDHARDCYATTSQKLNLERSLSRKGKRTMRNDDTAVRESADSPATIRGVTKGIKQAAVFQDGVGGFCVSCKFLKGCLTLVRNNEARNLVVCYCHTVHAHTKPIIVSSKTVLITQINLQNPSACH